MLKELALLAIPLLFGLGATVSGAVAPVYFPNAPAWTLHWAFWGGICLMILMLIDAVLLFSFRPAILSGILFNAGMVLISSAIIYQTSIKIGYSSYNSSDHVILRTLPNFVTPDDTQSYTVSWSPSEWLCFHSSDYESSSVLKEPKDTSPFVYLFNTGKEPLSNVRITWMIDVNDTVKDIVASNIFGSFIHDYDEGHISFDNQSRACIISLEREDVIEYPVI
jgi:hypothetical protein